MARRKRRSSSSSAARSQAVSQEALQQLKLILLFVGVLFLLAAIFNAQGIVFQYAHIQLNKVFGVITPLVALPLIWYVAFRIRPDVFAPRQPVVIGGILLMLGMSGLLHSLQRIDLLVAAQEGLGGGYLGYALYTGAKTIFGSFMSRVLFIVLMLAAAVLIVDKEIFPLPRLAEDEEEEDAYDGNAVPVQGEIKPSPLDRFKKKVVPQVKVAEMPQPKPVVIKPLPRTDNWDYPPLGLLEIIKSTPQPGNMQRRMELIKKTLSDFGIEVTMTEVHVGPTVTQYTLKPADGVKLNQITARRDDLALALAAESLRVEAPIPGKGLVGIEIPNEKKAMVGMRDILESDNFKRLGSKLGLALGRDAAGATMAVDLAKMPHALIAGATGSGKSVCVNSIILSMLVNNSPDELRMILVDPKRVELTAYNGLPHLLTPVITEPKDTVAALAWTVREMERRYKLFASVGKKNIEQYNQNPDIAEGKMPFLVVVIDELADLMMVAAREVEGSIVRLAQMARAVGIHLIVATQRPSVDVITGLIKANIPTRIAFAVTSQIDSRTIIDMAGAEQLLGYGDMLYMSTELGKPRRVQGVFASEKEINGIIAHIKRQVDGDRYDPSVLETRMESRLGGSRENGEIDDDLFNEAYEVVRQAGKASTTLLQTRLSVGYARAARLIQAMEDRNLIGPAKGSKPREVYESASSDGDDGSLEQYGDQE